MDAFDPVKSRAAWEIQEMPTGRHQWISFHNQINTAIIRQNGGVELLFGGYMTEFSPITGK